jgi:hypothetical protein
MKNSEKYFNNVCGAGWIIPCAGLCEGMDKVVTLSFGKAYWEVGAAGLRFRVRLAIEGIRRLSVRGVEADGVYTENVFVL